MPAEVMVPSRLMPRFPMPLQQKTNFLTSSGLSFTLPTAPEGPSDVTRSTDSEVIKLKEGEYESKSSSEYGEEGSGDDDDEEAQRPNKKRYHRHSQHQIQEMERVFQDCPHPDEKQRLELSLELKLDPKQVKFWFQNKRTQAKAQHERHDNAFLRSENEKLKAENLALREAMANVLCSSCGGPATAAEVCFDEQQLRVENVKLQEEIDRASTITAKQVGRPMITCLTAPSSTANSSLNNQLGVWPMSQTSLASNEVATSLEDTVAPSVGVTESEKRMVAELATAAMEEFTQVAQASQPLWVPDPRTGMEVLDNDQYLQCFPRALIESRVGWRRESTRETSLVMMNATSLVEMLMDVALWTEMFSCIVCKALPVEVLCNGKGGTHDGAIQLMYAEFQLPSPMVATRENYFLRYAKGMNHLWLVVDVSVDTLFAVNMKAPVTARGCRRRPSGCVIEEVSAGYCKVTWVEHVEVEDIGTQGVYEEVVKSGMAFGAGRWVATLRRQSERVRGSMVSSEGLVSDEGRRSMLKLAEKMSNSFSTGVSASREQTWTTLAGSRNGSTGGDDVRVLIRKRADGDAGSKLPGVVLSAATSLWLPVCPSRVLEFLQDYRMRTQWDILCNMGVVEQLLEVGKSSSSSSRHGNSVSLLRVNNANGFAGSNQPHMIILQDCFADESCCMLVYAPVDIAAMACVLEGGHPDCVALLPSGFAILPDSYNASSSPGSLLTVAFQILVDHSPTAKLSLGSVATVNNLISSTVVRIKNALVCDTA